MKQRKAVYSVIAVILCLLLSACSGKKTPTVVQPQTAEPTSVADTSETGWEAPTPAKEEAVTEVTVTDAFKAYYHMIDEKEHTIKGYTWHMGYNGEEPQPVALWDIYGDETPELIFFDTAQLQSGLAANMHIYTYKDGNLLELYSNEGIDYKTFPEGYYMFQTSNSKDLYMFMGIGDAAPITNYYIRFEDKGDKLEANAIYCQVIEENAAEYTKEGQAISGDDYTAETEALEGSITDWIMTNVQYMSDQLSKKSDNCFSQKGFEKALDYLNAYIEANGGWADGENEKDVKATITISWDETDCDYVGPAEGFNPTTMISCGLAVTISSMETAETGKVYSEKITQNGTIKTETIKIYNTNPYTLIFVEPIYPTNANPRETVKATISIPGEPDKELTYEDMANRGVTGIITLYVCVIENGKISAGETN